MIKFLKIIICVFFIQLSSTYAYADKGSLKAEQEVYGQFEAVCLSFLSDYSRALPVIEVIGEKIDAEVASKFIYPQTGNAWLIKGEFSKSILVLSDSGACTLSTPEGVSGEEVKNIFTEHNDALQVDSLKSGSRKEDFYKISFPDVFNSAQVNGIVIVTTSSLTSYDDSVTLNVIPENVLEEVR